MEPKEVDKSERLREKQVDMGTQKPLDDDQLALTLDGVGVEPATVPVVITLSLATAYFQLLEKVASLRGRPIHLCGLEVVDKCAQIRTTDASGSGFGRQAAIHTRDLLRSPLKPQGTKIMAELVLRQLRYLTSEVSVSLSGSGWTVPIREAEEPGPETTSELTGGRALVVRAGGRSPRVVLAMDTERTSFSLGTEERLAKEIAPYLYDEVDIEALIYRDEVGRIVDGELIRFEPVESGPGLEAWQTWMSENLPHWAKYETPEELAIALGRDGSDE